jgi:hypothetical protein
MANQSNHSALWQALAYYDGHIIRRTVHGQSQLGHQQILMNSRVSQCKFKQGETRVLTELDYQYVHADCETLARSAAHGDASDTLPKRFQLSHQMLVETSPVLARRVLLRLSSQCVAWTYARSVRLITGDYQVDAQSLLQ